MEACCLVYELDPEEHDLGRSLNTITQISKS